LKVNRKEFLGELERLKPAIGSTGSLAELSHLWFDGKTVYAFNGGLGIKAPLETEFKGGVPGKLLVGLLQSHSAEEAVIEEEENSLRVDLGKSSKTNLATLAPDRMPWDFPAKPAKSASALELTEDVIDALRRSLIVRSDKPAMTVHYGVTLVDNKGNLSFYTTDSAMMAQTSAAAEVDSKPIVLPRAFVTICELAAKVYQLPLGRRPARRSADRITAGLASAKVGA